VYYFTRGSPISFSCDASGEEEKKNHHLYASKSLLIVFLLNSIIWEARMKGIIKGERKA